MPALNLTPAEIRALAERVGLDPCDQGAIELAELVQQEIAVRVLADMRGGPVVARDLLGNERVFSAATADNLRIKSGISTRNTNGIVTRCHAQQCGDEMLCGRCGLTWATGDVDPPACAPVERRISMRRAVDK